MFAKPKNVDKIDRTSVPRKIKITNKRTNQIDLNQTNEREKNCSTVPLRCDRQTTVVSRVKYTNQ